MIRQIPRSVERGAPFTYDISLPIIKQVLSPPLIHQQGIICVVAFDRSSLRRIAPYASVVTPLRLASNALLVIRNIA
jgi:hypothetical protein